MNLDSINLLLWEALAQQAQSMTHRLRSRSVMCAPPHRDGEHASSGGTNAPAPAGAEIGVARFGTTVVATRANDLNKPPDGARCRRALISSTLTTFTLEAVGM